MLFMEHVNDSHCKCSKCLSCEELPKGSLQSGHKHSTVGWGQAQGVGAGAVGDAQGTWGARVPTVAGAVPRGARCTRTHTAVTSSSALPGQTTEPWDGLRHKRPARITESNS